MKYKGKSEIFLNNNAFTIIEVLISLGIMSIIILFGNNILLSIFSIQKSAEKNFSYLSIVNEYKAYLKQKKIIDYTVENIPENLNTNFKEHISGVAITPPLTDTILPSDIIIVPAPLYGTGVDRYATRALANVGNGLNIYQKSPSSTDADKILIPSTGLFLNIDGGICSPTCTSITGKWKVWVQWAKLANQNAAFYLRVEPINQKGVFLKKNNSLIDIRTTTNTTPLNFNLSNPDIVFSSVGTFSWQVPFKHGYIIVDIKGGDGGGAGGGMTGPYCSVPYLSRGQAGGLSSFSRNVVNLNAPGGEVAVTTGCGLSIGQAGNAGKAVQSIIKVSHNQIYSVVVGAGGAGGGAVGGAQEGADGANGSVKINVLFSVD